MELIVNDLSFHGQFSDVATFYKSMSTLMKMRNLSRKYGRELSCHRNVSHAQITSTLIMPQAITGFSKTQQRAIMLWLTRTVPHWEDQRTHSSDDYLESDDEIVTDTAIGEAAFRNFNNLDFRVVSLSPSNWTSSPLIVWWRTSISEDKQTEVQNYTDSTKLKNALVAVPRPLGTWKELEEVTRIRFQKLIIAGDAFDSLRGHPFVPSAATRILELLDVLEQFKNSFDANGKRTSAGDEIYQNHFTGDKAWFSDSSDGEKSDFKSDLTFDHPGEKGKKLFCTMHGKVKTPQIRIHFSWPIQADTPLYVVYIGNKLTKK